MGTCIVRCTADFINLVQVCTETKAGRIHAAGMVKDVTFGAVDDVNVNKSIDEAYQKST